MNDLTNPSPWAGQVALVSGAGSEAGIGFATARRLAQHGVKLLLTASSERVLQRAEELRAEGFDARAHAAFAAICRPAMYPNVSAGPSVMPAPG